MFLVFIMYAFMATTFIIGKAVLNYSTPLFFIGVRMVIAGILLLSYNYFFRKQKISFKKEDLLLYLKLSAVHIFIPFVFEFWSLQYISAAKTAMLYNLSPFITAVFAFFILNERVTKLKIIGLIVGFLGFIPILIAQLPQESVFGEWFFISVPELVLLGAIISAAYAWIVIKRAIVSQRYSLMTLNGISMFIAGISALFISLIIDSFIIPVTNYKSFLSLTLLIIIVGNVICYNLYGYLLKRYTATFLSFAGFTTPLFTALFQWHGISWHFYATAIIVFIGLYIFYKDELKHIYKKTKINKKVSHN